MAITESISRGDNEIVSGGGASGLKAQERTKNRRLVRNEGLIQRAPEKVRRRFSQSFFFHNEQQKQMKSIFPSAKMVIAFFLPAPLPHVQLIIISLQVEHDVIHNKTMSARGT